MIVSQGLDVSNGTMRYLLRLLEVESLEWRGNLY